MSGFVATMSLGAAEHDVQAEARDLALVYEELRGTHLTELETRSTQARAHVAGADAQADERGWTVVVGASHGPRHHPVLPDMVASTDGQRCLVSHDEAHGRTVLATDRFAAAPVYLAERDGMLYASSSAMVLAKHLAASADADGLRDFLVSGYQFGAQTHWEGVRRIEPGHMVVVEDGRHDERAYWRPAVDREVERMSRHQVVDRLLDVATSTLSERLATAQPWCDLTGGYDSRLLALLLSRAGVAFVGHTRESVRSPDIDIAGQVAGVRGWPWEFMLAPDDWPDRIAGAADRALADADGRLEVIELSRVVWWHAELARSNRHLLSAGGGEHLQYAAWKTELPFPGRARADVERWVDIMALKPNDFDVLAPGSRAATRGAYVTRLSRWIAPYAGEPSTRQLDLCYAYKSGGHFGAYRAADDASLTAELPFFFAPIFDTAFSIHHRHRGGFRVMRELMQRLDPQVAALTTTRGGPAVPMRATTLPKYFPYYASLARKAVNRTSELSLGKMPFPQHDTVPEIETLATRALVDALRRRGTVDLDDLRVGPLLSTNGLARMRTGAVGGTMLGRVLTAEMALAATDASL